MALIRVTHVEHIGQRVLRVVFTDGLVRELDFSPCCSGVFAALDDDATFRDVSVDAVAGTITFAGGIDFDPDVLHGDYEPASAHHPTLLRQYVLDRTA